MREATWDLHRGEGTSGSEGPFLRDFSRRREVETTMVKPLLLAVFGASMGGAFFSDGSPGLSIGSGGACLVPCHGILGHLQGKFLPLSTVMGTA